MKRRSVVIDSVARAEVAASVEWYCKRNLQAAEEFLKEFEYAVERIAENPAQFPTFAFGTRRVVFRKFPYSLVFREEGELVQIVAVAHARRHPGYWRKRIK